MNDSRTIYGFASAILVFGFSIWHSDLEDIARKQTTRREVLGAVVVDGLIAHLVHIHCRSDGNFTLERRVLRPKCVCVITCFCCVWGVRACGVSYYVVCESVRACGGNCVPCMWRVCASNIGVRVVRVCVCKYLCVVHV